jgi:ATP-dependent Clp protease ATP-binding subunit ClpC
LCFRRIEVRPDHIAEVASLWSGIPVKQLTADERSLLLDLDNKLRERVIGQEEAVSSISRSVKRSRVGLKDPSRPIATLLFCGPTGVGKTELAKSLAACYFGSVSIHISCILALITQGHSLLLFVHVTSIGSSVYVVICLSYYHSRRRT